MKCVSPLGALVRGFLSGCAGAAADLGYLALTSPIAPSPPKDAFRPPDDEQAEEQPTETVARRFVEMTRSRPLSDEAKKLGGQLVHFGFGGSWGAVYGLSCESFPSLRSPIGAAAFGATVYLIGPNVIVPAFKLGPLPTRVPPRFHAYMLGSHLVYGFTTWGTYEALRRIGADEEPTLAATIAAGAIGIFRSLALRKRARAIATKIPGRVRAGVERAREKIAA